MALKVFFKYLFKIDNEFCQAKVQMLEAREKLLEKVWRFS
jgi:hypothetical protein